MIIDSEQSAIIEKKKDASIFKLTIDSLGIDYELYDDSVEEYEVLMKSIINRLKPYTGNIERTFQIMAELKTLTNNQYYFLYDELRYNFTGRIKKIFIWIYTENWKELYEKYNGEKYESKRIN